MVAALADRRSFGDDMVVAAEIMAHALASLCVPMTEGMLRPFGMPGKNLGLPLLALPAAMHAGTP